VAVQSDGVVTASPGVCVGNEAKVHVEDPAGRALSNRRLKLSACGRRLRRNAQWKLSILIAASASRSLSAPR